MLEEELYRIWNSSYSDVLLNVSKKYRMVLKTRDVETTAASFIWGFVEYMFIAKYSITHKPQWLQCFQAWMKELDPLPTMSHDANVLIQYLKHGYFREVYHYCMNNDSTITRLLERHPLITKQQTIPQYSNDTLSSILQGLWNPSDPKLFPHSLLVRLIYYHNIPQDEDELEDCIESDQWIKKQIVGNPFNDAIVSILIRDLTTALSVLHHLNFSGFVHLIDILYRSDSIREYYIPNLEQIRDNLVIQYVESKLLHKDSLSLSRYWSIGFDYLMKCKSSTKLIIENITKVLIQKRGADPVFMNQLVNRLNEIGYTNLISNLIYKSKINEMKQTNNYPGLALMLKRFPSEDIKMNSIVHHLLSPKIRKQYKNDLTMWHIHINSIESYTNQKESIQLMLYSKLSYEMMNSNHEKACEYLSELLEQCKNMKDSHSIILSLLMEACISIEESYMKPSSLLLLLRHLEDSILDFKQLDDDESILLQKVRMYLIINAFGRT